MKAKTFYTDNGPMVSYDDFDILQRSHAELLKIADYYHDRDITYTEMPYKKWSEIINNAKKLELDDNLH